MLNVHVQMQKIAALNPSNNMLDFSVYQNMHNFLQLFQE